MADTTLNLYRACRRKDWGDKKFGGRDSEIQVDFKRAQGEGSLYPDYDGFMRKDGSFRAPDVTTFNDDVGNTWIRGVLNVNPETRKPYVDEGEGVSLNKHPGKFGYKDKG